MDSDEILTTVKSTDEIAKSIKPIDRDAVHKICSGQVVLNLAVAVKELVENALDAGATSVEIRLKEYGKDLIEISDNGSGVEEKNFAGLTLKYHTSKLREFSDLLGVTTFGFRGEALSSLCALSNLTVVTRHSSTEHGTRILYDHKGHIKEFSPCARQIGTTVTLMNLFNSLPVRQKEFHRNIKREFNKMTQILYAYCLVCEGTKIVCTNQTNNGSKSVVVSTQGGSVRDNIACVYGVKQLQTLLPFVPSYPENVVNIKEKFFADLGNIKIDTVTSDDTIDIGEPELELSEESSNDAGDVELSSKDSQSNFTSSQSSIASTARIESNISSVSRTSNKQGLNFNGYISSCAHGSGKSTTERQFYYVNSRPCEPQKIMKIINEVYKQYNPHQYPFVFLDLRLKRSSVDVNVTPDKRKVFLDREKYVIEVLKASLNKIFEHIPSTLKIENIFVEKNATQNRKIESFEKTPRIFSSFLSQFASKSNNDANDKPINNNKPTDSTVMSLDNYIISNKSFKNDEFPNGNDDLDVDIKESSDLITNVKVSAGITTLENGNNVYFDANSSINECEKNTDNGCSELDVVEKENMGEDLKEIVFLNFTNEIPLSQVVEISEVINENKSNSNVLGKKRKCTDSKLSESKEKVVKNNSDDTENINTVDKKAILINVTLDNIRSLMLEDSKLNNNKKNIEKVKFRSEINPIFNKKCEEELEKEISKNMFSQMNIIGQFNLGFIITQFEDDLFIIDQHATDEKYNFEILQKNTVLSNQKLVVPQSLELTGVNERVLIDNLEVFSKNGFTFDIDEDAPPTKRVKLLTIPMSNNYTFGKNDIEELLFILKDMPQEICRPSRIQAMFASRACRKSVMIGTALNKLTMRKLVDHMGLIDHPWNCPHGRPTIRHLVNTGLLKL